MSPNEQKDSQMPSVSRISTENSQTSIDTATSVQADTANRGCGTVLSPLGGNRSSPTGLPKSQDPQQSFLDGVWTWLNVSIDLIIRLT